MTRRLAPILVVAFFLLACAGAVLRTVAAEPDTDNVQVDLTEEERAFLAGKQLRLGIDENRPPFEFIDESGAYSGISAGFIALVSKRLGIPMIPQRGLSWTEAINKTKVGEMDIIPKMTPTPEREKFLNFTKPYTTFPSVIVTRKDHFVLGLDDLKGLKIGVVKGLVIEAALKRDRPDLTLVPLPDMETALRQLSAGKFDAFVDNLGAVTYVIDKVGLTNLKIAAQTPYTHDLAFGVRKDWPLLVSALDKALATITDQEKAAIKNQWLTIQYQTLIDWKTVGPVVAALFVVTVFVMIWNRRLGRAVKERIRTEHALRLQTEELQKQQERLKDTEAWYRGIIESAPDGIMVVDDKGIIILANTMMDRMFGYDSGELLGENVDMLVPAAVRDGHHLLRERFFQSSAIRDMGRGLNLLGVRKDGSEYPVEIGLSKLPGLGLRGPCVCASIRDITERVASERALAESRERLQSLLDTSPIAVAISTEGVVRFANPHFTRLLGPSVGDSSPQLYVNPADRERIVELLERQEAVSDFVVQMYGVDKKVHDFLATYIRTEYEGKPGILGWLADITRIKVIEKALTESEERSRLLLESVGEGIFGVDTSGVMTFANSTALRLLGYREEELLGRKIHPIIHHTRHDGSPYPEDECPMMASCGQGTANKGAMEVLWRKDGSSFFVNYSSTAMEKDGRGVGAVIIFRDVTERRRVEEDMKKYVKELERFNRLVTGREMKMIELKNEINSLRVKCGESVKYMSAMQAYEDREFKIFSENREESVFDWSMIGNMGEGRPNLGSAIDLGVYRLMHFSLRDALLTRFDPEISAGVFFHAGELTGREICRRMIKKRGSLEDFMIETQDLLANLKIGVLEIEKSDPANLNFTFVLSEDLHCSGMPVSKEAICSYDEGLLSGLLSERTGARFNVKEVNCWCLGDRLCRFEVRSTAQADLDVSPARRS